MNKSNDKQDQPEPKNEPICNPQQLDLLIKCSEKRDASEWNKWREENPEEEIWLQGANLKRAHLDGANLKNAHLEVAVLKNANLKGANLESSHLEGANLRGVHLEGTNLYGARLKESNLVFAHLEGVVLRFSNLKGADFRASVVDGSTLFWYCRVDHKTDFRSVGLDSCRIDEGTKYLLRYNRRRMNCEDWYKQHPRLTWLAKAFFWISDYGNSTWRIIQTFLIMSTCFATVYYIWGAVDYYLFGVDEHPGIVANLFIDQHGPIEWSLIPLRSIYFSVVTMTTLGFGDMHANSGSIWGYVLLSFQVILGYILIGVCPSN